MEAAGLAIGVIGLAGLFSSCLETVEKAQSYFSFGVDSHVLDTRFKATKVRLEKWGQLSGLRDNTKSPHPALSQHEISSAVEDILQIINTVCGVNAISPIHDASLGPPKLQSLQVKRRRKLTWALGGKAKRIDQVQLFETLVQQLHNLVPPEEPEGSHASPAELRQIVARIEEMGRGKSSLRFYVTYAEIKKPKHRGRSAPGLVVPLAMTVITILSKRGLRAHATGSSTGRNFRIGWIQIFPREQRCCGLMVQQASAKRFSVLE